MKLLSRSSRELKALYKINNQCYHLWACYNIMSFRQYLQKTWKRKGKVEKIMKFSSISEFEERVCKVESPVVCAEPWLDETKWLSYFCGCSFHEWVFLRMKYWFSLIPNDWLWRGENMRLAKIQYNFKSSHKFWRPLENYSVFWVVSFMNRDLTNNVALEYIFPNFVTNYDRSLSFKLTNNGKVANIDIS